MLYILTSTETILKVDVRVQESRIGDSNVEGVLNLKLKQTLTAESFKDQQAYLTASTTAAYVSFNKLDQRHRFRASVNLLACNNETYNFTQGSSSSGLGYALACFDAWWRINLQKSNSFAHPVFATGEVLTSGHIKAIGHIVEKLESTCKYVEENQGTISSFYLCYPQENDKDIPEALRKRLESIGGILIPSERLQHTLGQLLGDAYNGDPLGRWQPFKGLKSFDYEDSVRFFGRDKDVERLYSDIKQNSGLLIVSGVSGTGKSSLIKAGLIPKLEQEHKELHWAYCTPNSLKEKQGVLRFILEQLLIAWDIKDQNIDELVSTLNHSIEEGVTYLSSLVTPEAKQCLLYLDQYEEVFSQSAQDIDGIGSELSIIDGLAKAFSALNIVLAIRNEYLGRLLDNQALRSPIISNVASQLTSQEWEAIVHEQALFSGITFEQQYENNEVLDTIIIEEAISIPYALPMVSFLLEQLYSQAIEEKTNATVLQHKHYQALGGLTGAIAYRASTVLQESDASEKTKSTFFDYFVGVNPEGLPFARCVELADITSNKALSNLVKGFIDANLIVSVVGDADSSAVKLAHDSLFTHWDALKEWIVDSKEYLLWRYSIDGQFTRWQQATTNKADYFLKDNQILKEGKVYLKLNLIRDPNLNEYLSTSLKQKSRKQLSLFFVFIIIPLLLTGLYQWDKQRIKTYYYSAVGERWSVPFGINELTDKQVSHRTFSYKMEYQGGVLKRLSHVNSVGTLIKDENRENNALWEYQYTEQGKVQSVTVKSETKKTVQTNTFQFNDKTSAIVKFNLKFGVHKFNQIMRYRQFLPHNFKPETSRSNITNSDISQNLMTYSSNGFLVKKEFQNPYGTKKPYENQFYGVIYEYYNNGLKKLEYYIDNDDNITRGHNKFIQVKYEYDHFGNIMKEEKLSESGKISAHLTSIDEWGNINEKSNFYNNGKSKTYHGLGRTIYHIDLKGNVDVVYRFDTNNKLKDGAFSIAYIKNVYTSVGLLSEVSTFNSDHQPVNNKDGYFKIVRKIDAQGNTIEVVAYDNNLKPTTMGSGCLVNKYIYNKKNLLAETSCLDLNNNLTLNKIGVAKSTKKYNQWGFKKKESFFDERNKLLLHSGGFASVLLETDKRGNILSRSYFGINGNPIKIKGDAVKRTYKYDEQSNVTEISTWDEQGNLTELNGVATEKKVYDNLGRLIQEYFLNKMQFPTIDKPLNYHKKITQYSTKGNYITSINRYDINGNLVDVISQSTKKDIYPLKNINTNIFSLPEGAKVFIDDKYAGITPFHKHIPKGKHILKVVKAGYQELINTIEITEKKDYSSNFSLSIIPIPEVINTSSLEEKATIGDVESQFRLGIYYSDLKEYAEDLSIAEGWFKQAAINGHHKAMYQLGILYLKDKAKINDGISWLKKSANIGYIKAQHELGNEYLTGTNVNINYDTALKYYQMAAEKKYLPSYYNLARMSYFGWGQDKNIQEAFKWASISANGGYEPAFYLLGIIYSSSKFIHYDPEKAFYWHMLGAELGNEKSYYVVGRSYELGDGVNKDINKAVLWLMKAFQSEDKAVMSIAAARLGSIYKHGIGGILSNFDKSFLFWNKAIEMDNGTFTRSLAYLYLHGYGVELSYSKALELFKLAHSKGDKMATEWLIRNGEL